MAYQFERWLVDRQKARDERYTIANNLCVYLRKNDIDNYYPIEWNWVFSAYQMCGASTYRRHIEFRKTKVYKKLNLRRVAEKRLAENSWIPLDPTPDEKCSLIKKIFDMWGDLKRDSV